MMDRCGALARPHSRLPRLPRRLPGENRCTKASPPRIRSDLFPLLGFPLEHVRRPKDLGRSDDGDVHDRGDGHASPPWCRPPHSCGACQTGHVDCKKGPGPAISSPASRSPPLRPRQRRPPLGMAGRGISRAAPTRTPREGRVPKCFIRSWSHPTCTRRPLSFPLPPPEETADRQC